MIGNNNEKFGFVQYKNYSALEIKNSYNTFKFLLKYNNDCDNIFTQ